MIENASDSDKVKNSTNNHIFLRSEQFAHNFLLHFTVFLLGFTGILGRLITVPSDVLVWYRMLIAAFSIGCILLFSRQTLRMPVKDILIMAGIGVVVALHWITFFGAIKLANVSVTLLCLSATTLFVALAEPLVFRTRISWLEIALGVIIVVSLFLVLYRQMYGTEEQPEHFAAGVVTGIVSAILSGVFTLLNKKVATRYNGFVLTFYEMTGGVIAITAWFAATQNTGILEPLIWQDWLWLLVLGVICTGFAFWTMVRILQKVSAYTLVLAINMEPVYGFVMAAVIFGENKVLGESFYLGSAVIIASIFVYSWLKRKQNAPGKMPA